MSNMMIDGHQAVVAYDPELKTFRGEFVGLSGGADFYAAEVGELQREGAMSLRIFLQACERQGIEPHSRQAS